MDSAEALRRLVEVVGSDAVLRHDPLELDGVGLDCTLRPADGPALAVALQALERLGLAAIVRGGASGLGLGNPPRRADLLLSTERLSAIDELDAGEGVCHALAGTPLRELRRAVRAEGWELPMDPPGEAATLGGALAAAAVGPRAQAFGRPRDLVLGLEVALPRGERARCGGRVVKNVTGYDLAKLYVGSCGTLGVIEGAWLRLRPRPESVRLLEARLADAGRACQEGVAAARRPTARAAALSLGADGEVSLAVELAGDAPSVGRDAAELAAGIGAEPCDAGLAPLRALQAEASGLRFRLALLPSRLAAGLARLRTAGARLLAYPGLGLVWALFPLDGADARADADRAWLAVASTARDAGGSFRLESAPLFAKRGRDVFGEASPAWSLIGALKQRFDPKGVLNPGRFAGGV